MEMEMAMPGRSERFIFIGLIDRLPKKLAIVGGILLLALIGIVDHAAGYYMSFSLFYLLPICLVAVKAGRLGGILMSLLAAAVLFLVEEKLRPMEVSFVVLFWNVMLRWGFYLIIVLVLTELQAALRREALLGRLDPMTEIANSRVFMEQLENEIERCRRYGRPFSLAFFDLDDFKEVNDLFGHTEGNRLLFKAAHVLNDGVRAVDKVARLGGDEFGAIFPETEEPEILEIITRLQEKTKALTSEHGRTVTISVGFVVFRRPPESAEQALRTADNLMYSAKRKKKGSIGQEIVG
jgi:diguanylate cyclase (GGDEF)-like protein